MFSLSFLSAVGPANLILIRIPKAEELVAHKEVLSIALVALSFVSVGWLVIAVLYFFGIIFHPILTSFLMLSWTGYQIFRHFFLSKKNYVHLFIAENFLIIISISVLYFSVGMGENGAYVALILPYGVVSGLSLFFLTIRSKVLFQGNLLSSVKITAVKAFEFGLANFVSGGMSMLIPPAVVFISKPEYGAVIGLITQYLGVVALLPRALALNNLPDISIALKGGSIKSCCFLIKNFRKNIIFVNTLIFFLSLAFWYFASTYFYVDELGQEGSSLIFYILLISTVFSYVFYPDINYFMASEASRLLLFYNGLAFCLYVIFNCVVVLSGWNGIGGVLAILIFYLIVTSSRNIILFFRRRKEITRRLNEISV